MQKLPEKLYTAEQVREMDRIAIEDIGIPGIDLMRKAGLAIFNLIRKYYSDYQVVVFCGAGNNAGDGYIVANLAQHLGIYTEVYTLTKPENLQGDARLAHNEFVISGGVVKKFNNDMNLADCIIIDALLGTGLNRDVSGLYAEVITLINDSSCPVIAVDIPSGLNADTGFSMGATIKADYTVSFIALKQGMFTGFAAEYCGEILFSSLGIPENVILQIDSVTRLVRQCCLPKRHQCVHKGNNGHVLVVGGDIGFSGAVRLAAEAALRVGAGLVTVVTHKTHASFINMNRPELMCHGIDKAEEIQVLLTKASVVVLGPGLGQNQWGKDLFKQVATSDKTLVIDADGLNSLATCKVDRENWVLTPHPGEAAQLLRCSTGEIGKNRFAAVAKLQKQYGGVVVLKGAGTIISNGEEVAVSTTGNPGMASGGMGDTLAGMIGGLLAQKLGLYEAAKSAVYVHGKAADLSAQQDGEIGLLASDLLPFIRKLVN